ncbi:MAG TPA: glycosyltransferase family 39 protein [Gemmatimonadales bacterium]|nr:glycosyltransferase family 39 protein [Gemmatimonadales bacterium]
MIAAMALGWNLNGYRLLDPDEGRNAEVAREMALTNDYVVPHLDGLPYLDKPIAYFAAAAAVMEVTGPTEAAARLPAYLATLATIALLVAFARRRWGDQAGWIAGLAYATMVLPLAYARTAIFDSTLTLCTTGAILWFWDERPVAAWAALAIGTLTKGPIALALPLLALVVHALLTGIPPRRLFPWRGLAAFAAIVLPWFLVVADRHPDFPHYVFVRETIERMTTRTFHRTAPFWYYLPILPLAAFPWVVPALARVKHWRAGWDSRRDPPARDALLLACWVLVPLLFLSLNQSKLPQYVLPLIPAFALAASRNFAFDGSATAARAYVPIAVLLGVALVALTWWLPAPISLTSAEKAAIPPTAVALGIVALCSAALVGLGALARRPRTILFGYAVVVMAIPFLSGRLLVAVGDDRSSGAVASATATALHQSGDSGAILGVLAYPPSLPFYLRRIIPVATATGGELTSNYIADNVERFRTLPGSSLLPADYWREALARCAAPTVFVTSAGNRDSRAALGSALPLLMADDHYAAYGPCRPRSLAQPPQPPQPPRGGGRVR